MEYNHSALWISSLVEYARRYVENTVVASILVAGWLPVAFSVIAIDPREASTLFLVTQASAVAMVVFGPFDVWYYDERLLPEFFEHIEDIVEPGQESRLQELAERADGRFAGYWWAVVVPWVLLVVSVFFISDGYFAEQGITTAVEYWSYFGFFVYWGMFSGLGFHGGIITILTIKSFSDRFRLSIDPLHPDGLGGLSLVGRYAIRTTLILSTGALALPLSFQLAAHVGLNEPVYVGVGLYVVLLAAIFLYPTFEVNRKAQRLREDILEDHRRRIRDLESRLESTSLASTSASQLRENQSIQLEIQRIHREFGDYRDVQLYPLSISILLQLLSSLLLPILFILFELYISSVL